MIVIRVTLRALLWRRRSLALLAAVASVLFFTGLAIVRGDVAPDTQAIIAGRLLLTTIAPLVALVLAVAAIGDERESGTIVYLATAPRGRFAVALEKVLAATLAALVLLAPAMIAILILSIHLGVGIGNGLRGVAATTLVVTANTAIFTAVGLFMRRALVAGIIYILVWEGAIATVAPSAARLSVTAGAARSPMGVSSDCPRIWYRPKPPSRPHSSWSSSPSSARSSPGGVSVAWTSRRRPRRTRTRSNPASARPSRPAIPHGTADSDRNPVVGREVDPSGIEPLTSALPARRSPS